MKTETFPLDIPADLLQQVRKAAEKAGLSTAAALQRSIKLGLPKLTEETNGRITNVDPLPDNVLDKLYREREEDLDGIRQFIAAQPKNAE